MASTNFKSGATWSSEPTPIKTAIETDRVIVSIGTAPVHRLPGGASQVNKLILIDSLATAAKTVGLSKRYNDFTLSHVIQNAFASYGIKPLVLINVLDPNIHYKTVAPAPKSVVSGQIIITGEDDVIYDSVVIKSISGDKTFTLGTDYLLSYDKDENLVITLLKTGGAAKEKSLSVGYDKINPSAVTDADIIGGYDANTDTYTGLELIDFIPSELKVLPDYILVPGRSSATVLAVANTKAQLIEGRFRCKSVVDLDTSVVKTLSDTLPALNNNNILDPRQLVCWPNAIVDGQRDYLSTHLACRSKQIDTDNDGFPYESPSNKLINIQGLCLADGTPVKLNKTQTDYLRSIGVISACNDQGWRLQGNRTAAQTVSNDIKDVFIPAGRVIDWIGNMAAIMAGLLADRPGNRRLIESHTDSFQLILNSKLARGYTLGGRIEFPRDRNPDDNLMKGLYTFLISVGPVLPAERIHHILVVDVNYFKTLTR